MPEKNYPSNKIIAVVGPTSSGKSDLAVALAKKFNGEIISCDSRQIYKGMDLGTGKVEGKWRNGKFVYKGVVHHLIDFASPRKTYSSALFKTKAQKIISQIQKRGVVPILCGGTAHWIDAVVFNQQFPPVRPNAKLRRVLERKTAEELFLELKKSDPVRAKNIDCHNKRRLIRALEIIHATGGRPVPRLKQNSIYDTLWVGINPSRDELFKKIGARLKKRIKQGMFHEIETLHKQGLSWARLEDFGLEYKYGSLFLQGRLTRQQVFEQLWQAIWKYAKRQMTWWKRNRDIRWLDSHGQATLLVEKFL